MMLKDEMHELEMEKYLIKNGFEVFDSEGCTDSTLVIENAILLGYESTLDDEEKFLKFSRRYK